MKSDAEVAGAYDDRAEEYAELFLRALDNDKFESEWLARFADQVEPEALVADLGCGPGYVVDHLTRAGLRAVGYDVSPGQVEQARLAFPDSEFHVGNLGMVEAESAAFGGIISRYSLIHMPPERYDEVFAEWLRLLVPGAPLYVSFFGALVPEGHGRTFDHAVVTGYELFPATVADQLQRSGFTDLDVGVYEPPKDGRPLSQGKILARAPQRN